MRRTLVTIALRLTVGILVGQAFLLAQGTCSTAVITAFSVEHFPGLTADGTPTPGNAGAIAAASYNYPLGSFVTIEGLGSYRVADRGRLGSNHIDVLLATQTEARQFGVQQREVCRP